MPEEKTMSLPMNAAALEFFKTQVGSSSAVIGGAGILNKITGKTYKEDVKAGGGREVFAKASALGDAAAVISSTAHIITKSLPAVETLIKTNFVAGFTAAAGETVTATLAHDGHRVAQSAGGASFAFSSAGAATALANNAFPADPRLAKFKPFAIVMSSITGSILGYLGGSKVADWALGNTAQKAFDALYKVDNALHQVDKKAAALISPATNAAAEAVKALHEHKINSPVEAMQTPSQQISSKPLEKTSQTTKS